MDFVVVLYTKEERKRPYDRFDSLIQAAFWMGMEYRVPEGEGNLKSVRTEVYSAANPERIEELRDFEDLLLDRLIDHETKFFSEAPPSEDSEGLEEIPSPPEGPEDAEKGRLNAFEAEISDLKEKRAKGTLTEKQYQTRREALLKRWREDVDKSLLG